MKTINLSEYEISSVVNRFECFIRVS